MVCLRHRDVELILRLLKFFQDILEQKWDRLWPIRRRETGQCYDVPRVSDDYEITLRIDAHDEFCMNYRLMRRRFLRVGTEI